MPTYKVKFHGTMEYKGQIRKIEMNVEAIDESYVEDKLQQIGYVKINGLKIRKVS